MLTGCAQMCLCLSFGASVPAFYLLSKFWAHYFNSNRKQRYQLWGPNIPWIRLHELFCSQNDWFLFGLGWMVDRILFYLYCFHWPCHKEMMVPLLESRQGREKRNSHFLILWKAQMQQKYPEHTYISNWKVEWSWDTLPIYDMGLDRVSYKIHIYSIIN